MPYFGIEEEVFITEPEKPSLRSLYYLTKLLWKDPGFYYSHTASNFSRGKDVFSGLMSGIEIATSAHQTVDVLLTEFESLRKHLANACSGFIVPLGQLITGYTTTKTSAFHVHVGNCDNAAQVYANLVKYLPVLSLAMANAPCFNGNYFGQSFRMLNTFAVGELTGDPYDRMQDIIFAKRLGTIEIRVFDPVPDIVRLKEVLSAIEAIVNSNEKNPLDIDTYNRRRVQVATHGLNDEISALFEELQNIYPFSKELIAHTQSDKTWEIYTNNGVQGCYEELDKVYRKNLPHPRIIENPVANLYYSTIGFFGYYLPKAPYVVWKYLKES